MSILDLFYQARLEAEKPSLSPMERSAVKRIHGILASLVGSREVQSFCLTFAEEHAAIMATDPWFHWIYEVPHVRIIAADRSVAAKALQWWAMRGFRISGREADSSQITYRLGRDKDRMPDLYLIAYPSENSKCRMTLIGTENVERPIYKLVCS